MIFVNILGQVMGCGFDLNDFDINFVINSLFTFMKGEIELNVNYELNFNFEFDCGMKYYSNSNYYTGWNMSFDNMDDLSLLSSSYSESLMSRFDSISLGSKLTCVQVWLKLL